MEEAQEKEAKRKEAERSSKRKGGSRRARASPGGTNFSQNRKGPARPRRRTRSSSSATTSSSSYELLKCSKHVKREIQAVFKAFDANKDGSLNINEFRTYLKEPKERMPFLNSIFLTMDNDAMDGAERVNTYGVGELDMFEFFVADQCPCIASTWRTIVAAMRVDGRWVAAPDAIDARASIRHRRE